MSEIIRIESPEFESYHEMTEWIDTLESDPVPHAEFDVYSVDSVLQVFAAHREDEDVYNATVFVLASSHTEDEGSRRTEGPAHRTPIPFSPDRRR